VNPPSAAAARLNQPAPAVTESNVAQGVCPACGAVVAYTATECPACGYRARIDLDGVVAVESNSAGAPTEPATAPKPARVRRRLYRRELTIPLLLALAGLFALGLLYKRTVTPNAGARLDDDATIDRMIRHGDNAEVMQWLQNNPAHALAGLTPESAPKFILDLYDLGAVNITAIGSPTANLLAVELPADRDKRQKLIDWDSRWESDKNVPPTTDVGQKYLLIRLVAEAKAATSVPVGN
jgi:ribosomal protein L40E